MDESSATIELSIAWWLPLYLYPLAFICTITGLQPDESKVMHWVNRAIRIKVVRNAVQHDG
jgi:hypothetical protein